MDIFIIAFGLIFLLSSYYQWVWCWRLNGLGKIFYNRFGHESTRLSYGLFGIALIASAIRGLIASILATNWGKVFFHCTVVSGCREYFLFQVH